MTIGEAQKFFLARPITDELPLWSPEPKGVAVAMFASQREKGAMLVSDREVL